jgi:hypothetical protein
MDWLELTESVNGLTTSVFGESATYKTKLGAEKPISGVFAQKVVELRAGQTVGVASRRPTLFVRLSDLPAAPAKGDQVTVRGTVYAMIESQEDEGGGSLLILQVKG